MDICEECGVALCEECFYCHNRPSFHRCINFRVPESNCPGFEMGLEHFETDVIAYMRDCVAAFDTDTTVVRDNMNKAHALFGEHLIAWSEEFGMLYNGMLDVYRAGFPQEQGHFRNHSIEIGYTPHAVKTWVPDKIQLPRITAIELVARFDTLIEKYTNSQEAA